MNVALVHDDLIQHGGAERVFKTLVEIWPNVSIYASMVTNQWRSALAKSEKLKTSFMDKLPFREQLYRYYFPFYPFAFESFDFSNYDVVISSSTRFAHGVITKPETTHVCCMHSPGRMWWEPAGYFSRLATISPFLSWLRVWDYAAAQRVDYFVANSKSVQAKIKKYYDRESTVIYPFVELERFSEDVTRYALCVNTDTSFPYNASRITHNDSYFLIVSRLAVWKRIDIAIEACNRLQLPLVIVGDGPDRNRLEKLAGPTVEFKGRLSDEGVVDCYQSAKALIFPQREDFGIAPLEAMACGRPVLALGAGGALETVLPGETGEFFYPQTVEALTRTLSDFRSERYGPVVCRQQAERFGKIRFVESIRQFVSEAVRRSRGGTGAF